MNTKFKKALLKSIISLSLMFIVILSTIIPTWAEENPTYDISSWAIGTLNEGERYGIYPLDWYLDSFREGISEERLETLLTNTQNKIAALELDKKEGFTPISSKVDGTREDVIIRLYNILAQYNIPVGDSPIDYMQERNILQGTDKGLELDSICTTEQAVVLATRLVEDTYNLLEAGSKGFAWKVEHNGNTIYLLGSIHIGSGEVYPISKKLKEAFHNSDALIVEANLYEQEGGMDYFLEKATYQDGTTLKDYVSEETYEKFLQVCEIYGLPAEMFAQFKPWSIANNLTVLTSSDSDSLEEGSQAALLGIDMYFLSNAVLLQKPIIELEGIRFQADLFDSLSPEYQEVLLNSALDSILNPQDDESLDAAKLMEEWLNQWKKGDIEGFTESYVGNLETSEDELTKMLFGERDRNMTERIIEILESEEKGTYFLVVGAGHFVTPDTIIYQLIEKGYNVEVFY